MRKPARRNGPGQPRPRVPRAHGAPGARTRPGAAAGAPVRRRLLAYLEERADRPGEHAREAYEKYAETRAGLEDRMRTQIGWADKGVREARAKATDNDKHVLHRAGRPLGEAGRQGQGHRADAGPAGGRRRAAQGVGAADGDRRRAAVRVRWPPRCATRSSTAAVSASARSACRSTGPTGSPSPARTGRASPR